MIPKCQVRNNQFIRTLTASGVLWGDKYNKVLTHSKQQESITTRDQNVLRKEYKIKISYKRTEKRNEEKYSLLSRLFRGEKKYQSFLFLYSKEDYCIPS